MAALQDAKYGLYSDESRKFFLPVLRQKPRTVVKVKKIL